MSRRIWYLAKAYVHYDPDTPGWNEYALIRARDNREAREILRLMIEQDRQTIANGDEDGNGTYFGDSWEYMTTEILGLDAVTEGEKTTLMRLGVGYTPIVGHLMERIRQRNRPAVEATPPF